MDHTLRASGTGISQTQGFRMTTTTLTFDSAQTEFQTGTHELLASRDRLYRELERMARLHDFNRQAVRAPLSEPLPLLVAQAIQDIFEAEIGAIWHIERLSPDTLPAFAMSGGPEPTEAIQSMGRALLEGTALSGRQTAWMLSAPELAALRPTLHLTQAVACPCFDAAERLVAVLLAGHTDAATDLYEPLEPELCSTLTLLGQQTAALLESRKERQLLNRKIQTLQASEERLGLVLRGSKDGWWDINLKDLNIFFSERWWTMLGHAPGSVPADPLAWQALVHPDDLAHVNVVLARAMKGESGECEAEFRVRHQDGHYLHVLARATVGCDEHGKPCRFTGSMIDMTERKHAEDQMRKLAFFDPLTGLPNRRMMLDRLQQALSQSSRTKRHGAVLMLDLDRFKQLNDSRGHEVGDLLLKQVGDRLKASVREHDTVARMGGDEYIVILQHLESSPAEACNDALAFGQKLLQVLSAPYYLEGPDIACDIGVSIGIALFRGRESADHLLRQADVALYRAKDSGRRTVRLFDAEAQRQVDARFAIEDNLRKALGSNEFHLDYQPMVDAVGNVVGAEALLRWTPSQGPGKGAAVAPCDFIPLAEETGLILPIGRWVMGAACRQLALWQQAPETANLMLSVNVSARQFREAEFVEDVKAALATSGANPAGLKIEVTEAAVMSGELQALTCMHSLKELGVKLSLDDFGTGYSSLAYLTRLPLDEIKIDRSFVRDVPAETGDLAIVHAILAMSRSLDLAVVAEGVETRQQFNMLADQGCLLFQGYLFGHPSAAGRVMNKH